MRLDRLYCTWFGWVEIKSEKWTLDVFKTVSCLFYIFLNLKVCRGIGILTMNSDIWISVSWFLFSYFIVTLIWPGEVKVDLANFDLKLQENLLSTLFFGKISNLAEMSSKSFWTSDMTSKMTFWLIFVRSLAAVPLCWPPSFHSVLLLLETTRGREKSGQAEVRSPSGGVPVRILICFWSLAVESAGGGGFAFLPALSLFQRGLLGPHQS